MLLNCHLLFLSKNVTFFKSFLFFLNNRKFVVILFFLGDIVVIKVIDDILSVYGIVIGSEIDDGNQVFGSYMLLKDTFSFGAHILLLVFSRVDVSLM